MAKRTIPTKNYVILLGLIVLIICACFASYNLYGYYKDSKVKVSPLASNVILYEDLKNTTVEINADTFLVISYLQDEKVHENENEIKKLLKRKNLIDNVMYLDITELKNDDTFMEDLNKTLKLEKNLEITSFPAVVFYKEGSPSYTASSDAHLLNSGDFEHIIDMYSLES